ncbi:hypothetical protein HDV02_006165 [Globomyces sp. JEL0801]|nr:hypothetical protein HDV02_006165 [Globomyces sp. JEL0801]
MSIFEGFGSNFELNASLQPSYDGFGLFTASQTAGRIAFVNRDLMICKSTVKQFKNRKLQDSLLELERSLPEVHERLYIISFLLLLKKDTPKAFLEYNEKLPKVVGSPIGWNEESIEYQLLEGTGLDMSVNAKKSKLIAEFDHLKPIFEIISSDICLEDFIWADYILWSRAMSFNQLNPNYKDDLHIVPTIDFCNHSQTPNASWTLKDSGMELHLHNNVHLNSNEEIFISYGDKPNSELLFLHGFTLEENSNNSIAIPLPFIEYTMENQSEKILLKQKLIKDLNLSRIIEVHSPGFYKCHKDFSLNSLKGMVSNISFITLILCVLTDEQELPNDQSIFSNIDSIESLKTLMENLKDIDIVQLRLFAILSDVISGYIESLSQELEDEMKGLNVKVRFVEILRRKQLETLLDAQKVLILLQQKFSMKPSVIEYLHSNS